MGGDAGTPLFPALMLTVSVGGIFILSALIGVLIIGLENRIGPLSKGRSRLIERGRTPLPGWSEEEFTMVAEPSTANQGRRRDAAAIGRRLKHRSDRSPSYGVTLKPS
ncbi:hypothetical protein [Streptosporangium sp. KLBMP 9127]|nr:hypothetical protein [Streptosporangium sp. KLBMP 9127]